MYQFSITDLFNNGFDVTDINEIKNDLYGYGDIYDRD